MRDISGEMKGAEFVNGQAFDTADPLYVVFPSTGREWLIPVDRAVLADAGIPIDPDSTFCADINYYASTPDELAPTNFRKWATWLPSSEVNIDRVPGD